MFLFFLYFAALVVFSIWIIQRYICITKEVYCFVGAHISSRQPVIIAAPRDTFWVDWNPTIYRAIIVKYFAFHYWP